ncbi:unnamed protein product [Fraxinus pennsylvanica]|uniref:Uncharacterized protein n=1 Tax=Fraxinus pennsylvanica TaxID=56036 RepID=A0AAD2ABP1_9LAMI|nr:unnamed protein product [Fraxinus pennsylvanica]
MVQRMHDMPDMPAPIKKSVASCFAESLFVDEIALIEMPKKFSFPNMKVYDGTIDSDDHIAQYRQRIFTAVIPRDIRKAYMFQPRESFIPSYNQQTTISAFRKGLLQDIDMYKKLTKHPCFTMENVLAKAWAQIK